jgi:hypothetical protein
VSTTENSTITDSRLAALCSEQIRQAFGRYQNQFQEISERARQRFLMRDWRGSHADAAERLHLYSAQLDQLVSTIRSLMGERCQDRRVWMAIKAVFSSFIAQDPRWEIAETFFNSLTRRIFSTEGVDQAIEFVDPDFDAPPTDLPGGLLATRSGACLRELLMGALTDTGAGGFPATCWRNLEGQAIQAEERILAALPRDGGEITLELVSAAFGKKGRSRQESLWPYVFGIRVRKGSGLTPFSSTSWICPFSSLTPGRIFGWPSVALTNWCAICAR